MAREHAEVQVRVRQLGRVLYREFVQPIFDLIDRLFARSGTEPGE